MRFGIFSTFDNPDGDIVSCYREQVQLVGLAEGLGFEECWIAEHHFDELAASPSILALLAYLAGGAKTIKLGSAAVLLPFRNPVQVAEDVATIDILSNGRFLFGVAKGGPFPLQNKHFGVSKEQARAMMEEALSLIERLFSEDHVNFSGDFYKVDDLTLVPKPLRKDLPIYVATATEASIRHAAARGYGLMAPSPSPLASVAASAKTYWSALAPGARGELALARFYFAAETRDAALEQAIPFIDGFVAHKRNIFNAFGAGSPPKFDAGTIIDRSLIGSFEEVAARIDRIEDEIGCTSLLLKPATRSFKQSCKTLTDFARYLRPNLRS